MLASGIGGFFVATKVTEYFFEKTKGKGGGGKENERETGEGKQKAGQNGQKDKEEKESEDSDGENEEEQGDEGAGSEGAHMAGDTLFGRAALRYVIGKSIRRNPGPYSPLYSYYVGRGLLGEGTSGRFAVRSWSLRNGQLCQTDPQGPLDCVSFKVIIGVPAEGNPDVEMTPKQVAKLVATAELKAKKAKIAAEAKELEEAQKAGKTIEPKDKKAEPKEDTSVLTMDMQEERPPVYGEQVATMVIGERGFPIIKGNLINFPAFLPSIDDPKIAKAGDADAIKPETTISGEAAKAENPEPAQAKAEPVKPEAPKPEAPKVAATAPAAPRPRAGFNDPTVKPVGFAAPKVVDKGPFRSPTEIKAAATPVSLQPPAVGKPAWDRILGKTMVPYGAKTSKNQPYLGFFMDDGKFLQMTRDPKGPFEVIVTVSTWAYKDARLCVTGLQQVAEKPTGKQAKNAEAKPVTGEKSGTTCVIPQISQQDETNLISFKNQKLMVGAHIVLPTRTAMKPEPYGPFKPGAIRAVSAPAGRSAAVPAAPTANGFGKTRI